MPLGSESGLLDQASIHREVEEMAARGLRVLAFARKEVAAASQSVPHAEVAEGHELSWSAGDDGSAAAGSDSRRPCLPDEPVSRSR